MITAIINFLLVATLVALLIYRFMYEEDFEWDVSHMEEDFENFLSEHLSKHLLSETELKEYKKVRDEIKYQQFKAKIPNFDSGL